MERQWASMEISRTSPGAGDPVHGIRNAGRRGRGILPIAKGNEAEPAGGDTERVREFIGRYGVVYGDGQRQPEGGVWPGCCKATHDIAWGNSCVGGRESFVEGEGNNKYESRRNTRE